MSEAVMMVQPFGGNDPSQQRTPLGILQQLHALVAALPEAIDASAVREAFRIEEVIRARAAREKFFKASLFADPAWDMLLVLYAAECAQKRISVSSLADAAGVPQSTALRWMDALRAEELIVRYPDPLDGRRVFVQLSEKGEKAMKEYLQSLPAGLRPL